MRATIETFSQKLNGILILSLFFLCASVDALGELYKYTNEDGVTVLDSHVPARYIKGGYTILSLHGRVLEVVPRMLTAEELQARELALALEAERQREKEEREAADANLLRLYSRPEDVIRARDVKLESIDGFISMTRSNLARLENQKRRVEAEAADVERTGGSVLQATLDRIGNIEQRIQQTEKQIQQKLSEKEILRGEYAVDLERVRELYGKPRA